MNEILTRDKLPENYKWDMTALYADDAAWEQERAAVAAELDTLGALAGELGQPERLLTALEHMFQLG